MDKLWKTSANPFHIRIYFSTSSFPCDVGNVENLDFSSFHHPFAAFLSNGFPEKGQETSSGNSNLIFMPVLRAALSELSCGEIMGKQGAFPQFFQVRF
ncbi:MAG: hypothetical protein J6K55_07670 [Clostridia bacterium]|nr:hypothetical protein [Clostridia bacterium]